jgi:hypothetical protein
MPRKRIRGDQTITGDLSVGGNLAVTGTLTPAAGTEYADNAFAIKNAATPTKKVTISAAGVTAGQTRVLTAPDYNATLASLAGVETLTNKTLTTPKIGIIHDANGNEALEMTAAANAVNQPELVNAAAGAPVELKTKGGDAAIPIKVTPKGGAPFMVAAPLVDLTDPVAKNDASDQAIAAATLAKKVYLRDCNGGARQDTLPAAADLVAAFPGAYAKLSFFLVVSNTTAGNFTLTLAAPDAAVTLEGTMTIAQNNTKLFLVRLTNVGAGTEAYTVRSLGTLVH